MKRILWNTLIIFLLVVNSSYAKDFYALGISDYKSGKYASATENFELAIKLNPQNVNARYYLAQAYLNQKLINDAKMQYSRIILLAPDCETAKLAQRGLSLIRQSELGIVSTAKGTNSQMGDNYIQYVLTDGKIQKWAEFPISVYIMPNKHRELVKKAFEQWQSKTKSIVKFNFSSNKNSKITVTFKDKLEANAEKESYVAGYSKPYYKNGALGKSDITILTVDPIDKTELPDDFIFFSTLHEIGHSLGFNGHSPKEEDVMASSASEPKENLTQRDINTMRLYYTLDEESLKAMTSGQTDLKLQQLLDYVKQFPNKAVSWSNLADHYRSKGMLTEAIQNYKKSISIEPNNAELYNLIGTTYQKSGDKENAYKNLKRACDLDKNNDFYIYQFVKSCTKPEEKAIGQKYLKDYVKANPDKVNDDKIKSLLK